MSAVEPEGDRRGDDAGGGGDEGNHWLSRWGRTGAIAAALGMAIIFAAAAWYALQRADMQPATMAEVPLVKADSEPAKEKPEDPGGLKIPNQDKLVFERITPKPETPMVEKLAPAPEEPIVETAAPAAPKLAAAEMPKSGEDAAAPKPMAEPPAAPAKVTAEGMTGAVAPAAPGAADTAKTAKLESLLPAAGSMQKGGKDSAALPTAMTEKKPAMKSPAKPVPAPPSPAKAAQEKMVQAKAPAAKAPVAKPVQSGYRIQMASYRTAKQAEAAWARLQRKHSDILGGLSGHTARADLGKRGTYYRVQAGFFKSAALARQACRKLKAKRQDCIIVPPK